MKKILICFSAAVGMIACAHTYRSYTVNNTNASNSIRSADPNLEKYRVGSEELQIMRNRRRGGVYTVDDMATIKLSAKDLYSLMQNSVPEDGDSLVLFFVKYKSDKDAARYELKRPGLGKKIKHESSAVVAYTKAGAINTSPRESARVMAPSAAYDIGVVCPPPAGCGCEVEQ